MSGDKCACTFMKCEGPLCKQCSPVPTWLWELSQAELPGSKYIPQKFVCWEPGSQCGL